MSDCVPCPAEADPFAGLSDGERRVLDLAFAGESHKAIATALQVSVRTVERRRAAALSRLGVRTLVEAAALRHGRALPDGGCPAVTAAFRGAAVGLALGGADGRLTAVNPALCRLLKRGERELVGAGFAELTHPDDVAASAALLAGLLAGEFPFYRLRKRYLAGDGSVVPVELTASRVRAAGGPAAFCQVVPDFP